MVARWHYWKTKEKDKPKLVKEDLMIHDDEVKSWVDKCPEHDHEILHSDDDGIVMCIRFNNKKEDVDEARKINQKN